MAAYVSRYAQAFADVVSSVGLNAAEIDQQLTDFADTWKGSAELQSFFENPAIPAGEKVALLDKLNVRLGLTRELRNLIAVLINNGRIGGVLEVIKAYRSILQSRAGVCQAEIVTARELGEEEKATLLVEVARLAGARVEPSFKLDGAVLGGAVVRIGSTVYDGSVKGRLERLKAALLAS